MNVAVIMSLYNPTTDELNNIIKMLRFANQWIILDDSEKQVECEEISTIKASDCVDYSWNDGNIGLCRSLNKGIQKAIGLGADWVLMMDSDSSLYNDIFSIYENAISFLSIEHIAILAPQHNYSRHKRLPHKGYKKKKLVMLSGCALSVEVIKKIGMFDERFFIDGLDHEWCLRAKKAGYQIIECSNAMINHNPAITKELRIFNVPIFKYGWDIPTRYYYQFRASRVIHKEYHDFVCDSICLYKLLKSIILFDNRSAYIKAWRQAKADYMRGFFGKYDDKTSITSES